MTVLTLRELVFALTGAFRLARFDLSGLALLDLTAHGAARSFWAAAVVLPAYIVMAGLRADGWAADEAGAARLLLEIPAYVIGWTAFPVLVWYLVNGLDIETRYFAFLTAYNWSIVVQTAVYLPATLIAQSGVLPAQIAAGLVMGVVMAMLFYQWFVMRVTLGFSRPMCAVLVLADLVLSLALNTAVGAAAAG